MPSAWLPGSHPPHLPLPHPAHSIATFCSPPPYLSLKPALHHPPGPRCSTRSIFLLQGTFGNVRRHLWLSRCVGGCTGTWRVEARAAGKHPTVHRVAPHPAQSVNDAEVEKPFPGPSHHHLLPAQAQGPLNQPSCRHLGSAPTDPSLPRSQSHFNTSILLLYFCADPSSSPGPSRPGVIDLRASPPPKLMESIWEGHTLLHSVNRTPQNRQGERRGGGASWSLHLGGPPGPGTSDT